MRPTPEFKPQQSNTVRVLLLEDDALIADLVRASLKGVEWGEVALEWSDTLQGALERLESGAFDLVITDLNLPDSKGLETIESLVRATDRLILVLTGEQEAGLREAAIGYGAYDLMSKDRLDSAELERLVRLASLQANTFRSLREGEARFRGLLQLSSDWFWEQDSELRTTYVSADYAEKAGMSPASRLGRHRWETGSTPLSCSWEEHRLLLEQRKPFHDFEYSRIGDDGRLRYLSVSGEPVFGAGGEFLGYRGVGRDITARKKEEEALRQFRAAMDTSGDMIHLVDRQTMRYIDVNQTACKASGCTREEFLQKGPADVSPLSRARLEQVYDEMIASGETTCVESEHRHADGSFFPVEVVRRAVRSGERWIVVAILRDITERRQADEALRASELRFRSLTGLSSDMYWEQDAEYRFTQISGANPAWLTDRRGQMIGKRRWEQSYFNMTDADWSAHKADLEARKSYRDLELGRINESGEKVWISVSGEPVLDESGAFKGYRGVGKDITERKRTEQLLQLEHTVTRALAEADSTQAGLVAAVRAVCETEGWECGRYLRVDETAGLLRFGQAWSAQNPAIERFIAGSREVSYAPGMGLAGRVWQSAQPLWVADVSKDSRTIQKSVARETGLRGANFFPVVSEGKVIGVLAFNSREAREPEERLLQAVRAIGSQIGQFVQRKEAEKVQRESESRFRGLTELSSDFYWETDALHRIVRASQGSQDKPVISGRQVGKARWDLPSTFPGAAGWAAHQAVLDAHQPFRDFEFARVDAEGNERHLSVSGEPMHDESGAFKGYRGVGKDITARKREERLLALEQTVALKLAEAVSVAEGLQAAMGAICQSEKWDCARYFAEDKALGVLRFEQAWVLDAAPLQSFLEHSRNAPLRKGQGLVGFVWESGEPLWVEDTSKDPRVVLKAPAGEAGLRGSFLFPVAFEGEVTGVLSISSRSVRRPDERLLRTMRVIGAQLGQFLTRKHAESALAESEARFRQTFELAATGFAHISLEGRFIRANRKVCETLGYSESELVGRAAQDLSHPEDHDVSVKAGIDRLRAGKLPSLSFERRYVRKDGAIVWLRVTIAIAKNAQDEPDYEIVVFEDITERRQREDALNRFRIALDSSADMFFLIDVRTGALVDFNDSVCRVLGYEREELLGQKTGVMRVDRPQDELLQDYRAMAGSAQRAESSAVTYRRKDGSTFQVESSRRIIDTQEGPMMVVNSRDLTERLRAEERQAAHLRYQEKIARFGESALGSREAGELVEDALQTVLEALCANAVAYIERVPGRQELVVRGTAGLAGGEHDLPSGVPYGPGDAVSLALERGELALVERGAAGSVSLPLAWAQAFPCAVLVPVHGEREVQGALCAFSEGPRSCGPEESRFLAAVASVLSTGLQRIASETRLAFLAQFDPLTGLPNRALLADRFSQMIVHARRHDTPLGVLFIDLDQFKLVNDSLGHAGGDELLKEAARRLQAAIRPGDTVARISGDEFAVILADLAKPDDAALVAQKIIDCLAAPVAVRGHEVFVTASIGIATCPTDGADAETLLAAADAAMYRAKQSGRNAYQFFTADINQRSRARAQLGSELRRALERDEFALVYQPKFDLRSGQPCAAEALLRWRHPERGTVPPVEFIPVLEETGLIVPVGEWVLRRACEDLKSWMAAGLAPVPVAVNLSARQFRQQDLDVRIRDLVREAGVAPELIELEITESQLMHDPDHAARVIQALSEGGIRVAIDDFGTGYSSLSYLTRFPVAALKIDRSFVADVLSDRADAAIVRAIIDLAHTLGFLVIAEGVETEAQAVLLRGLGCEQAQGYFFARPMSDADFRALLLPAQTGLIDKSKSPAENRLRRRPGEASARARSGR